MNESAMLVKWKVENGCEVITEEGDKVCTLPKGRTKAQQLATKYRAVLISKMPEAMQLLMVSSLLLDALGEPVKAQQIREFLKKDMPE